MTYASAPFWWLTCDAPACCNRRPSGDYEVSAWSDQQNALDSDWVAADNDRLHFCDDHRRYVCGECEKSEGREYPLDHEGMCDECWAKDAKTGHGVKPEPWPQIGPDLLDGAS